MRALRIGAIVMGIAVGLLFLAVVAILVFVDPNDYRGDIERTVRERTGRELVLGGKLELKVFPWLAIGIHDVRLGNPPGFGPQPFVSVASARLGVKLIPLLGKRLEISRVAVEGLTANLISRKGANNWTVSESGPAAAGGGGGSRSETPSIAGLEVTKATLVYRDEAHGTTNELSNLEIHTGPLGGGTPVSARIAFDYGDGASSPAARIAAQMRLTLPEHSGPVGIQDLEVNGRWLKDVPAGSEGVAFSLKSADISLDTEAQSLAPTTLEAVLGDVPLTVTARGEKLFSDRVVTGTILFAKASPHKVLQSLRIAPPQTRDPGVLSALALRTDYRLTQKQVQLSGLDLTLDDTRVKGSAAIEDLESTALSFNLDIGNLNVDRYLAPVPKGGSTSRQAPATPAGAKPPTPLPIDALRKLNAHGTLRVASITLDGLSFTAVSLPLAAKGGLVHLGPTQAHLYGGGYNGDITLDARPDQAHLSLNEHLHGVDIAAVMKGLADSTRVSGHADANVVVVGTGNTDTALLRSLGGKIDFNVKQGALNGVDVWYEIRAANALLKHESLPPRPQPARTVFNTLSGSGALDKGVMHNDDLKIETDYLKSHGKGTLDFVSQAINYELVAEVYELPPTGAGAEKANLKAAEIPLLITGTLASLKVRPDLEGLAKARIREEVQKKAGDLRKTLGDKLKGLFSH